ncbi:unnamed protein product [Darwinula stevensoni]|uniref:Translational activator of cytochrome c oxidase 1 n=1 Tax=Darwinula stevensoni TaxID=69355 RepID=A0A7R9A3Y1_9CRUS|nr:unnamed protein product [Darwinula stevensoni]CAG0888901.1 unnamed protein product [Darwinula stevensoni]
MCSGTNGALTFEEEVDLQGEADDEEKGNENDCEEKDETREARSSDLLFRRGDARPGVSVFLYLPSLLSRILVARHRGWLGDDRYDGCDAHKGSAWVAFTVPMDAATLESEEHGGAERSHEGAPMLDSKHGGAGRSHVVVSLFQLRSCFVRSKWQNIKHTKMAKDEEKSKLHAKFAYLIRTAVKDGGGSTDIKLNSKLAEVIEAAKSKGVNMSTIQNAMKASSKDNAKPYLLEVRGPGGSMFLLDVFTENLKRTKQEITNILNKTNAAWADSGLRNLFEEKGIIQAENVKKKTWDEVLEDAIEAGSEDAEEGPDELVQFVCSPQDLQKVKCNLEGRGYTILSADASFLPVSPVTISENHLKHVDKMCERLEERDDVLQIHSNLV